MSLRFLPTACPTCKRTGLATKAAATPNNATPANGNKIDLRSYNRHISYIKIQLHYYALKNTIPSVHVHSHPQYYFRDRNLIHYILNIHVLGYIHHHHVYYLYYNRNHYHHMVYCLFHIHHLVYNHNHLHFHFQHIRIDL